MGIALIKLKIMPESPDTDLESIKQKGKEGIEKLSGEVTSYEEEPIAFGLKALMAFIRISEDNETDTVEEIFKNIESVSSVDIVDYRRDFT